MLGGQGGRVVSRLGSQRAEIKYRLLTYGPVTLDKLPSPRKCPDLRNIRNSAAALEKAVAPHSSTPAWKIPWMEEPGRLQTMGSLRVRHD